MAVNFPDEIAVYSAPAGRLNIGQITVPTTNAVEIAGNNPDRRSLVITNTDAANYIAIADGPGLSTAQGHIIPAGQSLTLSAYNGPLFAIAHTAAVQVTYCEESA